MKALLVLTLAWLAATSSAYGFVDPPTFSPHAPNSSQPITVNVRHGECNAVYAIGPGAPPLRIEYAPHVVDIIAPGLINFEGFCIIPVSTATFPIGALPAGEYQVRIFTVDGVFAYTQTTLVATSTLTVAQGPPVYSIPTIGGGVALLLITLIAIFARRELNNARRATAILAVFFGGSAAAQEKAILVPLPFFFCPCPSSSALASCSCPCLVISCELHYSRIPMTTRTTSQQIADLEARIARLRTKDRALENGQKIILGGMLLQAAKRDPKMAAWVIAEAAKAITRKIDQDRLAPLLAELSGVAEKPTS